MFGSTPFRVLLILTFFVALIGGFAWYAANLKYQKDTAHLQFVDPNNELWTQAKTQATATIDTMVALYPQYSAHTFVKFNHAGPSGFKEDIWAKVTTMGPGYVSVVIEEQYLTENQTENQKELPLGQVIDWMVELPNGNIRGGYTTQALLQLQLQKGNAPTDSINADLDKFDDKL